MKLNVLNREHGKKGQISTLHQQGRIPAIVYVRGEENKVISVDLAEFEAVQRQVRKGFLSTVIFELNLDGEKIKAIVKDIDHHRTTYKIQHLDFQQLYDDVNVNVNVPLNFVGAVDCAGIKLGGFLRPVKRSVKVSCLPKHIPTEFRLDVTKLQIKQSKRVRDLVVPANVKVIPAAENVLVVIAK